MERYLINVILFVVLILAVILDVFLLYPPTLSAHTLPNGGLTGKLTAGDGNMKTGGRESMNINKFSHDRFLRETRGRFTDQRPYVETPERRLAIMKMKARNELNGRMTRKESDCTYIRGAPKGSMKLRVLYALPGSGSTWLRYLLELASGYYTGSHYRDNDDYMAGFRGEALDPMDRSALVIKSRGPNISVAFEAGKFDEAIILVRNPYHTIISSFYKQQYEQFGYINDSLFETEEWTAYATLESQKWFFGARCTCLDFKPSVTVFYEDLLNNTGYELRRVIDFLNVSSSEERLKCVLRHSRVFKKYKRKEDLATDPYSGNLKIIINKRIKALRRHLTLEDCGTVPEYEVPEPEYEALELKPDMHNEHDEPGT